MRSWYNFPMKCTLCPLACGADRPLRAGACGTTGITVAKACLHPYEEPFLAHTNGAGAVFFGGCSLRCKFCQNFEVSRAQKGRNVSPGGLAEIFASLENAGADCLDLVTCDHVVPLVAEALDLAKPRIPVVFNTGGYCTKEQLEIIAPYVDVWLPDAKFFSEELSERYTGRRDYFRVFRRALAFMAEKEINFDGEKLLSGIAVRHLVMPGCTSDSLQILDFLKESLPEGAPLSLMRQYTPMGDIEGLPELGRRVTAREYRRVRDHALQLGFSVLYTQGKESAEKAFIPVWDD